jgi:hypothetical protein
MGQERQRIFMADQGRTTMERGKDAGERHIARLLRFLGTDGARPRKAALGGKALIEAGERGTISISRAHLEDAMRRGLVASAGGLLRATSQGRAFLQLMAAGADVFAAPPQQREEIEIGEGGASRRLTVNLSESPLAQIANRRDRRGRRFLTEDECAAGERLRADYERARIMPRLGIDWEAPVSGRKRKAAGSGMEELTEMVLAARARVERALEAVGPELSGVLVDICCFLKGLERVETERGWPARSAKVVLKTALCALDRHYRPPSRGRRHILHWGAPDYRPKTAGPDPS